MTTFVENLTAIIWSVYVLVPILLLASTYFTYKTGFVQLRFLPHTIKLLTSSTTTGNDETSISSFQAFIIGLASRIGTGNLAGVATALITGGPGAIFWMWVAALFGAANAFIESTLAQLFKIADDETKYRGGPAYYITTALKNRPLAITFATIFITFFSLSIIALQANTITTSVSNILIPAFNFDSNITFTVIGGILALVSGYVIFSGAQKIVDFSTIVVSAMAVVYLLMSFFVILLNFSALPSVIHLIVSSAFDPSSIAGGTLGAIVSTGFKRGLFSNEAGLGTAPNAAASADVKHPVVQGLIQSLGALIDTIVICSLTAGIILISGIPLEGNDGITITQLALQHTLGDASAIILTISIIFFAFSTILGIFFYAQSNYEFLVPSKRGLKQYKSLVIIFIFAGSITNSAFLWTLGDLGTGITGLINIIAILPLGKYSVLLLKDYQQQLKAGIKEPIFDSRNYE